MTWTSPEFDQRIADWLEIDPSTAPPEVLTTVVAAIPSIHQTRRGLLAPRRFALMNGTMRIATAALVAVVAVGGVAYLLGSGGPGATATPTPTDAPTPSPAATLSPPVFEVQFSSPTYGYDALHPAGWNVGAGTELGTAATLALGGHSGNGEYWDLYGTSASAGITGLLATSTIVPPGMSEDAWITAYQAPQVDVQGRTCIPERAGWEPITVDGRTGGLYVGCHFVEAMLFVDRRVYIFYFVNVVAPQADVEATGRVLLAAFLETVSLHPERAAATVAPTP